MKTPDGMRRRTRIVNLIFVTWVNGLTKDEVHIFKVFFN